MRWCGFLSPTARRGRLHDAEGWTAARSRTSWISTSPRPNNVCMMLVSAHGARARSDGSTANVPLRCWDARKHVSATTWTGTPAATATAVKHLASCPTCPPLYASLVSVRDAMAGGLQDPDTVIPRAVGPRIPADCGTSADAPQWGRGRFVDVSRCGRHRDRQQVPRQRGLLRVPRRRPGSSGPQAFARATGTRWACRPTSADAVVVSQPPSITAPPGIVRQVSAAIC